MEEKERYKIYKDNRGNSYIFDTSKNVDYKIYQEFVNLLNEQDKHIKELERQTKFNFDYRDRCQLEEYQKWADKEITGLTKLYDELNKRYCKQQDELDIVREENNELKQSQKQLAIEELEKLKTAIISKREITYFKFDNFSKGKDNAYYLVIEIINSQIKDLDINYDTTGSKK